MHPLISPADLYAHPAHPSSFNGGNNVWLKIQIMKLFLKQLFCCLPTTSYFFKSINILLNTPSSPPETSSYISIKYIISQLWTEEDQQNL